MSLADMCVLLLLAASRMESTGRPGFIHVSQAFKDLTPGEAWTATGGLEVKGKYSRGCCAAQRVKPP